MKINCLDQLANKNSDKYQITSADAIRMRRILSTRPDLAYFMKSFIWTSVAAFPAPWIELSSALMVSYRNGI